MEKEKNKIVLTGCRATGKSSVGRILAGKLGFVFLDTDQEIENMEGMSIKEMVSRHGWGYFRKLESDFLHSLFSSEKLVVAPGGGAILHQEVWMQLMETSFIVWLKADLETICRRLAGDNVSDSQRPSLTGEDVIQEVRAVLEEREPFYERGSHITVDTEKTISEIVKEIENKWVQFINYE